MGNQLIVCIGLTSIDKSDKYYKYSYCTGTVYCIKVSSFYYLLSLRVHIEISYLCLIGPKSNDILQELRKTDINNVNNRGILQ